MNEAARAFFIKRARIFSIVAEPRNRIFDPIVGPRSQLLRKLIDHFPYRTGLESRDPDIHKMRIETARPGGFARTAILGAKLVLTPDPLTICLADLGKLTDR